MSAFPEKELDQVPSSRVISREDVSENGTIEFQCRAEERSGLPDPWVAANHVPTWYRELSPSMTESPDGVMTTPSTGKRCGPFNESLGAGWLLRAPVRIELVKEGGSIAVQNDAATEYVTPLNTDDGSSDANSTFKKPDVLIDLRWAVDVPDDYGVLITPALNRSEPMLEPMSYYHLPRGRTEDQPFVELAAHLWEDSVTVEKGEPMVSVVPFPDATIPNEARVAPLEEESSVRRVQKRNDNRLSVRPSFYRKEIWCPRVGTALRDAETPSDADRSDDGREVRREASDVPTDPTAIEDRRTMMVDEYESFEELYDDDHETTAHLGLEVPTVPEGTVEFLGREEFYDMLPTPVDGTEFVQPWHRNMNSRIPEVAESEFPIQEGVLRAMSVGFVVRNEIELSLRRDPQAQGRYRVSTDVPDGLNPATVQDDRIIGRDHPNMPMTITNVNSRWLYRSPPGGCSLFLPPMNHFQTEYRAFSGIVETDEWYGFLNVPGRLSNESDEFVLPRGMPLIQVLPYRRGEEIMTGRITHRSRGDAGEQ